MSNEQFRVFCGEMKHDCHDGSVYIMFLGDLFYESCYDFVMARLEHSLKETAMIKRLCYLCVAGVECNQDICS